MDRKAQLQFRHLTHDAQVSAIRRLALRGLDDLEIARDTGWNADDVRRVLQPPMVMGFIPWALGRLRRSGSTGGV